MPWYTMNDARKEASRETATEYPRLSDVVRIAKDAGGWQPRGLPTDWQDGDIVFSRAELFAFARLLALELRAKCGSTSAANRASGTRGWRW